MKMVNTKSRGHIFMDKYDVLIKWNEEDNCFAATIPGINRFHAYGETRIEAVKQLGILAATHPEYLEAKSRPSRPS